MRPQPTAPAAQSAWSALLAGWGAHAPGTVQLVSVPVERCALASLWSARAGAVAPGPAFLLAPHGELTVGIGAAAVVTAHGGDRFSSLRVQADALFARARGGVPRLWGGFSFAPGAERDPWWREWPAARFVLPRWCYREDAQGAQLTLAITDGYSPAEAHAEWARLLASAPPPSDATPTAQLRDEMTLAEWTVLVDAIRAAIDGGRFHKIVAARSAVVQATAPFDEQALLQRLVAPACTRFAFAGGATLFVGATPERLVRRSGRLVESEALAGTIATDGDETMLRSSKKEREEHDWVVRGVTDTLAPLALDVQAEPEPELVKLRHVTHLRTPIRATLRRDTHVLDLVAALHPTPALGGLPRQEAVDFIVQHEPTTRGWYGAPIGWFDATGDGAFWVALRSGVVDGTRARIYTGAGIVGASLAAHEWQETALKQRALATALGVVA